MISQILILFNTRCCQLHSSNPLLDDLSSLSVPDYFFPYIHIFSPYVKAVLSTGHIAIARDPLTLRWSLKSLSRVRSDSLLSKRTTFGQNIVFILDIPFFLDKLQNIYQLPSTYLILLYKYAAIYCNHYMIILRPLNTQQPKLQLQTSVIRAD